jgi:hypothetical protein
VLASPDPGHPADAGLFHSVPNQGGGTDPGSSDPVVEAGATDEKKSHLKSFASSGAKLILRGVKETAFGPVRSVVGGLCYLLDNYEVWHFLASVLHNSYRHTRQRKRTRNR